MTYATTDDVVVSLGRSLTADEATQADGLLGRIERRIIRRIRDLAAQVAGDATLEGVVVEIEADSVARVIRNPEGLRQEQAGDYMYTRATDVPLGVLTITDEEWSRLGVSASAFTIAPSLGVSERTWLAPDLWAST